MSASSSSSAARGPQHIPPHPPSHAASLTPSHSYRPRRTGERKRKSVRGCIVGSDLSVLNLGVCRPSTVFLDVVFYGRHMSFDGICNRLRFIDTKCFTLFQTCTFHSLTHLCRAVVVKKGAAELPGITDDAKPRRLGPKRATSIRKLFNLKNVGALRGVASVPNHILIFCYDALCLQ